MTDTPDDPKHRQLATTVLRQASDSDRKALLAWAKRLLEIKESSLSKAQKTKAAIACTMDMKAVLPFVRAIGAEIKRIGWTARSLPARIGLSAAAVAAAAFSGQAAGLAMMGWAVAVPLWIVFGAGGAFAGVLIEEARCLVSAPPPDSTKSGSD